MALSERCQDILCGVAIAGGVVASSAIGLSVAAGVLELATGGGNLLMSVRREQEDRCRKLLERVRRQLAKDYKAWIEKECGRGSDRAIEVEQAIDGLDEILPVIKPSVADVVEVGLNADRLFHAMITRLPTNSMYRPDGTARNVLKAIVHGTYALVRTDPAFTNELASLSFERIFTHLEDLGRKLDTGFLELKLQSAREHEEEMAAIAREKGVPIEALRPLFEAVEAEVPEKDWEQAVHAAVEALLERAYGEPLAFNDGEEIARAIAEARDKLSRLDTEGAIAHLRRARAEQAELREAKARGEARLATEEAEILKLAFRFDQAIAAFEDAARLDPENAWAWYEIGDIRMSRGGLASAEAAYEKGALAAKLSGDERDLSVSHDKIGNVRTAQGNLTGALQAFEAALAIREKLSIADPGNAEWLRDLSISHNRIGDVRTAQGNLTGALQAFEAALAIREKLSIADPGNAQWQRDLSVSHNRIGDVRTAQGNLTGALQAFEADLAIAEKLANADPGNAQWQRDLSVSHDRTGDVRTAQGNLTGALQAFEAALAIAEKLAKADPGNAQWQRDLIISNVKLAECGSAPANRYEAALRIARELNKTGQLAPVDGWMVDELEKRLAAARTGSD